MNAERSAQESLLGVGPNASADDIRAALADSNLDPDKVRELEEKLGAR